MSFRRDQRGFVFSLDATLGILIVMLVMAGVASVVRPGAIYEQYGFLRLRRQADDAFEVMQIIGVMDNLENLVANNDLGPAENNARDNLRNILPRDVQFKFVFGDNRLIVYPTPDNDAWDNLFDSLDEVAVASRIWIRAPGAGLPDENVQVLAWLDDVYDVAFMDDIDNDEPWDVTRVENSDQTYFRNEMLRDNGGTRHYDVVFMPDADAGFDSDTVDNLVAFAEDGGRLVTGGYTFEKEDGSTSSSEGAIYETLWHIHGVIDWGRDEGAGVLKQLAGPSENEYNYMTVIDTDHIVTSEFSVGDNIGYPNVSAYPQWFYQVENGRVLADHQSDPEGLVGTPDPWPGIIVRDGPFTVDDRTILGSGYLFNKRFALATEDNDPAKQPKDEPLWFELLKKAIGGNRLTIEPITLYVWRGAEVE